jgi:glycine oxidase
MAGMAHDVVVIGGGLVGSSIAFELARQKLRVLVLDSGQPASEASWAAAGMLTLPTEPDTDEHLLRLARASLEEYPAFVAAVEDTSGLRTGYRRCGALELFFGPEGLQLQRQHGARLAGFRIVAEELGSGQVRALEPAVNPDVAAAIRLHDEAVVDSRRLTRAVLVAAQRLGVEVRPGTPASAVQSEAGGCRVMVASGDLLLAGHVVIAAGAASSQLGHVGRYAPTRPVRGQIVALDGSRLALHHTLRTPGGYLVAHDDGRLLAGSTLEEAGFAHAVTAGGLLHILRTAVRMVPAVAQLPVLETYSGLRPDTPDHLPILGPTDLPGVSVATGHFRNGILLAPVTARLARAWILGEPPTIPLEPFSPLRFLRHSQPSAAHAV